MEQPIRKTADNDGTYTDGQTEKAFREQLTDFLNRYKLPFEAINFVIERVTTTHLFKGESFSNKGKICNKMGILFKGLLYASFSPAESEDEKVSRFFYLPQNSIVTSFDSFSTNTASNESIIAIEESYLMCLERQYLYFLYDNYPEANRLGRVLAEQSYLSAQWRNHFLQTLSARDRIRVFFEKQPDLFSRVSRQQMASYLNMNRNLFSEHFNQG